MYTRDAAHLLACHVLHQAVAAHWFMLACAGRGASAAAGNAFQSVCSIAHLKAAKLEANSLHAQALWQHQAIHITQSTVPDRMKFQSIWFLGKGDGLLGAVWLQISDVHEIKQSHSSLQAPFIKQVHMEYLA